VRIVLDRELQVKHLKKWTLASLVITDLMRRAIPWTLLWMERRRLHSDLNFSSTQRIASIVAVAMVFALIFALMNPYGWLLLAALIAAAYLLNRDLFLLLDEKGGARLAVGGFFLQQLYYLYSLLGLALGIIVYLLGSRSGQDQSLKKSAQS